MSEKPFWQSKKFVYALSGFVAALILALLPLAVPSIDEETQAALIDLMPQVFAVAMFLIAGHALTDALSLAVGVQGMSLKDAAHALIDAVADDEPDTEALPVPEREHMPLGEQRNA